MKTVATNPAKMSFVNFVKYLTTTDPWKAATRIAMIADQTAIQKRQGRNSIPAPLVNW